MNKLLAFYLLVFMTIVSCSKDDSVVEPIDSLEPLVELQFTNSPIELQGIQAMFASNIPYDEYDKTKFDVFLPSSTTPTGLVIFIHGGGFTGGDKTFIYNDNYKNEIVELLSNDIAVATINYRLISTNDNEGVLKSLHDSKRALQYIRYIHNELNINKEKICLFGSSAGASTALWLATNDDLKHINSSDAVFQESTRVKGIALNATQSSLDIETRWLGDVFIEFGNTLDDIIQEFGTGTVYSFYGVSNHAEYETTEIETYRQEVDMLSLLSADDPEMWVKNTGGHNNEPMTTSSFNHHPFHAREIKEFADAAGVPNITIYGNPILYDNSNNENFVQFLTRKINE
ncbi:alpha/beta hydrolase [Ichthyenterobacterium sp. W332]|uniref:Alpha/beta hydrolase n=1 Tax=Microcosmobacter mediterraneus TaxID=3075607 RepID=A0ABU2YJ01_9FLAO|nr:alpha/beta hydrolase [Ichthyenterobacterium sp. W332]MDT0557215.1 alpha/beta hydrolase [Ichthyenterobacterium sp. W332]